MKTIKQVAGIVVLVFLAGCTTTFRPWKLSEIDEGMGRAQVIKILGDPNYTEMKDGTEFLYYSYSEDYNPAPANSDIRAYDATREFREQQFRRSLKEYNYAVKLVDGKVLNYKELTD